MENNNSVRYVARVNENKSIELSRNPPFCKTDVMRDFNSSDIGKVFWRVGSYGALTQCLIHELKEDNTAVIRLANLTNLRNQEYNMETEIEYWASSTYGTDVLQESKEYYYDLEEAKKFQALGVTFIGISSDQSMIKRGAQQIVKAMRS